MNLIIKFLNGWLKFRKEKISHKSDMLQIERRMMFHRNVPDLQEVKEKTGHRFGELQEIFNEFDPGKIPSLKEYPDKYEMITRTVIYRLPKKSTIKGVSDLLELEFSMWFGHDYGDFTRKQELAEKVLKFKQRSFSENPFDAGIN